MKSDAKRLRLVSLAGALMVIPWECFMYFGFTFSFRGQESFWAWAFVWFAFALNIPAVLVSWVSPRLSAYWILVNITVSMAIGIVFVGKRYFENPGSLSNYTVGWLDGFAGLVLASVLFWFAPAAFAFGTLIVIHSERIESRPIKAAGTEP